MLYQLPAHLSFCLVADRLVFLDLRRDRYFALDGAADRAFRALITNGGANSGDGPADDRLRLLAERGLLEEIGTTAPIKAQPDFMPIRSLVESREPAAKAGAAAAAEIFLRLLLVNRALKRGRLETLLSELRERKSRIPTDADCAARAAGLGSVFLATRPFVPVAPNCLSDSLALVGFLLRRGVRSDLVLGVKLDPFAAHAWVQTRDRLLNDRVDGASEFKPVLVI